jgi:hypothetical protein
MIERLEPRCVLNDGPTAMLDGIAPPLGNKLGDSPLVASPGVGTNDRMNAPAISSRGMNGYTPEFVQNSDYTSLGAGNHLVYGPSNVYQMVIVTLLPSNGDENLYAVTIFVVPPPSPDNLAVNTVHVDPSKASVSESHAPTGPTGNAGNAFAVAVQSPETLSHTAAPIGFDATNIAATVQTLMAKMPAAVVVNQALTTAVHDTAFWYNGSAIEQTISSIIYEAPLAQNSAAIGANLASGAGAPVLVNAKTALANSASSNSVANWPVQKASLVGLPLNVAAVERALEKVMGEIGQLEASVGTWLDSQHLAPVVVAITVVTLGAGTAVYLCRRGSKRAQKRANEEASSSWLFARLQSIPDAS